MSKDLFGIEHKGEPKKENPYKGRSRAHPYPPGSGPKGESCGTCARARCLPYHGKNYWKCWYMRHTWTHGLGTDIRLKDPACKLWKEKQCGA